MILCFNRGTAYEIIPIWRATMHLWLSAIKTNFFFVGTRVSWFCQLTPKGFILLRTLFTRTHKNWLYVFRGDGYLKFDGHSSFLSSKLVEILLFEARLLKFESYNLARRQMLFRVWRNMIFCQKRNSSVLIALSWLFAHLNFSLFTLMPLFI